MVSMKPLVRTRYKQIIVVSRTTVKIFVIMKMSVPVHFTWSSTFPKVTYGSAFPPVT